jgi:hypothetical protein
MRARKRRKVDNLDARFLIAPPRLARFINNMADAEFWQLCGSKRRNKTLVYDVLLPWQFWQGMTWGRRPHSVYGFYMAQAFLEKPDVVDMLWNRFGLKGVLTEELNERRSWLEFLRNFVGSDLILTSEYNGVPDQYWILQAVDSNLLRVTLGKWERCEESDEDSIDVDEEGTEDQDDEEEDTIEYFVYDLTPCESIPTAWTSCPAVGSAKPSLSLHAFPQARAFFEMDLFCADVRKIITSYLLAENPT